MYAGWNNVAHRPFCEGCEACHPMTLEQKERARFEAQERVEVKRALRRALATLGVDNMHVTVR